MPEKVLLAEMTWPEVKERLRKTDIALVPIGSTEQHGPHLPLQTDTFIAYEIAKRAAELVKDDVKAVVAPAIPFGASYEWMNKPGTVTLSPDTCAAIVKDVCMSLLHHGFRKIVIVNGHASNHAYIVKAIREIGEIDGYIFSTNSWFQLASDVLTKVLVSPAWHACEGETSVALALGLPAAMEKAVRDFPDPPSKYFSHDLTSSPKFYTVSSVFHGTDSGIVGDPTKATEEKGEEIVKTTVSRLADFLRELRSLK